ncbi:putative acyl-CoA transferase/carnitine dehydratase [Schinkia azotoformans MEV2011]|uniref:Putative acyl-CoA transferase/carnitine dehydratase n=1 Tax=Schinkia azotoformans MEV2011 TaxID=1348973 RepID=A0A072NMN4_SCHAZ|nr:CaiB/BaiF CoA-transferase family protein [Schinkia azotoformans]KEF38517.1 putative acyl-CoA transferase/carnitine dehydratase [Schinkia azotoformans MEV2011]MEC1695126.1 CaiB/BaiF CoA-transferase family protein [Schinkia azotoformans]MEC1717696.1 CaiB/BaiF CoA-transferase family protein [Schinkia azotoformans]MEC1723815.1 CaiB/BaiF CoA-transferase family protein [Schinkia azotoformans]MEC1742366.1 CaiB/BaiF CoA-transferase family protein [Schinkia azotoformans]
MPGALEGVRVLDLTRVLAGPYCTMILGDLGAEIIKVEAPGGSDDTRYWGPPYKETESAYYLCANRNKRAITLNLKTEQGREVLKKLLIESDVVIENFKSGTMEKWGLSYSELKELNPRIIHCSITGFGHNGPYQQLPGYDFIIQAMSGLMSITGSEQSGPVKVGVAISDLFTGLYANIGILAALNERNQSGEGQSIDISLFDSQLSALANVASNYLISGKIPGLLGNNHPNIVPYQPFDTKDGKMVVAVGNDGQFRKLCSVLGIEDIGVDERYATNSKRLENRDELTEILSLQFKVKTSKEWLIDLNESGIPAGPIQNMKEVFEDPQVAARNMVYEVNHPTIGEIKLVGSPLKLSRTPVQVRSHPPLAGEHSKEVLLEIGYTNEMIEGMKELKII